ncbi:alpha/beta hydrolase [Alkalibacterium sp. 20]|uniref:alpha/beta hydrolase n=1 Tax=Alkalibacterium sp. 20 TaxID=1798803 RepID=UPI0009004533|nr:alpha/beta hydrolase [Alkalibacterium sp. 20]OJF97138.1 alpha/beta hydrolase [Alkalibacterium sp. 20]
MKKSTKWGLLGALGLTTSFFTYVSTYFYKTAVSISKKEFVEEYSMEEISLDDPWEDEKRWYQTVEKDILFQRATDGLLLSGLFIPAKEESRKVVIIAHGYSSSNLDMAPWAKLFYDLGFNLLLPDARGHGESEGNYIGFGWHERKDYVLWIEQMIEKLGDDLEVVLYGLSMGGATVMNVSGEAIPINVKAIVEDCGYSSVSKEMAHQLKIMYKLPQFPIIPLTSFITKMKAGFWFGEANPEKQVQKSQTPLLFIHGDEDTFVPTHMAYDVYHATSGPKELYIVPGAAHAYGYVTDKDEYRLRIKRFLSRHLSNINQT